MSPGRYIFFLVTFCGIFNDFGESTDTCNRQTAEKGLVDCVSFGSSYRRSQWAVCGTETEIRHSGRHICQDAYCWLPCMGITTGRWRGFVSDECYCNSADKVSNNTDFDLKCYLPTGKACTWLKDCLSHKNPCQTQNVVDQFGQYYCKVFDQNSQTLSSEGNTYIESIENCLRINLYGLIFTGSYRTCQKWKDSALRAHRYCFKKRSLTKSFCNLRINEQCYIFWTLKSIITKAFNDSVRNILDSLRQCYLGNVNSKEKQITVAVTSASFTTVDNVMDSLARTLDWPSRNIVWDGQKLNKEPETVTAINVIFKPKYEYDFTETSQAATEIRMESEINRIETELQNGNLGVLGVFWSDDHSAYFQGFGKCPFFVGEGGIFDEYFPEIEELRNVRFNLFRRQRTNGEVLNFFDDESIKSSSYNGNLTTYFITHGFRSHGGSDWVERMSTAFLQQDDCNVVVVDWKQAADNKLWNYEQAAVNTRLIGCLLGKMVEKLNLLKNAQYSDMHLVGHSLGAHLSGFAGAFTGGKIGRITGLDPAGPEFTGLNIQFRLDESDAVFVDVIHTDTDTYGIEQPSGNIDFYPNGGEDQPGCFADMFSCSHGRAYEYFTESINLESNSSCNFWACQCTRDEYEDGNCHTGRTCTRMGFNLTTGIEGSFFLNINDEPPFCTETYPDKRRKKREAKYKEGRR